MDRKAQRPSPCSIRISHIELEAAIASAHCRDAILEEIAGIIHHRIADIDTAIVDRRRERPLVPGDGDKADGIAKETPTDTEFTTSTNWDLRFDAKNVRLAKIVIPAAQLTPGE